MWEVAILRSLEMALRMAAFLIVLSAVGPVLSQDVDESCAWLEALSPKITSINRMRWKTFYLP